MASLFKRPGSDKWWIRYSRDGKQIRKSTNASDKDEALLQLRETELVLTQGNLAGGVSQQLVKSIQQEAIHPTAIKTVFDSRRKHVGTTTSETYKSRDTRFLSWLSENHPDVKLISDVTRPTMRAFLDMISDGHSNRTHNGYLRRLRSVFRSAVKDGLCMDEPTAGIDFLPESESNRRAYTEEELRSLFGAASGETSLLTTIGLYAGAMRMSDIIALTWKNIDLKKDTIRWRMSKRRGKPMEIAIHPRLKEQLQATSPSQRKGPVLPSFHGNRDRASEAFRQALVRAGLKKDTRPEINKRFAERRRERKKAETEGKTYTPGTTTRKKSELDFHSLRYNFVSILKTQGCPEAIARSIMGHSSIEVSAIYTQIDADSERKWVTSLPDVTAQ